MRVVIYLMVLFNYLASSTGIGLSRHFCMGKLRDVSIGANRPSNACGKCGMAKKAAKTCCQDELTFSKLSVEHGQLAIGELPPISIALLLQPMGYEAAHAVCYTQERQPVAKGPPLRAGVDAQSFLKMFRC